MTRGGSTCAWDERSNRSGEPGAQAPETGPAKCRAKKVQRCLSFQNMLCCFLFPPSLADHTGLVLKNIFTNLIRQPNTPGKLL